MKIEMTAKPAGGKAIETSVDKHRIRTDLTKSSGGEGSAPEPLDMLFAALASCTANYLLEFCQSRDIDSEGMAVALTADRTQDGGLFDDVALTLHLPHAFPEKYRRAAVKAAEQCTVKKHLNADIRVQTDVA